MLLSLYSSILTSGYLLGLAKIKTQTSGMHAILGLKSARQSLYPKFNPAPQHKSGDLMQFNEHLLT